MVQLVKLVNLKLVVPIRCSSHLKIHDDTFLIKSMHGLASVHKVFQITYCALDNTCLYLFYTNFSIIQLNKLFSFGTIERNIEFNLKHSVPLEGIDEKYL